MRTKLLGGVLLILFLSLSVHVYGYELVIAHVNDTHSFLDSSVQKLEINENEIFVEAGGWPRLKTKVDRLRTVEKNVLLVHAGDSVQGTLYFNTYHGKAEIDFLNLFDFDAMVLGNHEFDKGPLFLEHMISRARFPVLSANADFSKEQELGKLIKPYVVKDIDGDKVGIIGLTTVSVMESSNQGAAAFYSPKDAVDKYINDLESQGINKIIALTHIGYEKDLALAQATVGIDVIVGGHSHFLLDNDDNLSSLGLMSEGEYPTTVTNINGDSVCVVTAWEKSKVIGVLNVLFDKKGKVQDCSGLPVLMVNDKFYMEEDGKRNLVDEKKRKKIMTAIEQNPSVEIVGEDSPALELLVSFKKGIEHRQQEYLGDAEENFKHHRVRGALSPTSDDFPYSDIAPVVSRAVLARVNIGDKLADISLINAGAIRQGLLRGAITAGDVYALIPYENDLVVLEMSGQVLKSALNFGVQNGGGSFLYMAGARYQVDVRKPAGTQLTGAQIQQKGQWHEIEDENIYRVVTNSYLADGGNGYEMFEKQARVIGIIAMTEAEVFINYIRQQKTLSKPKQETVIFSQDS